MIYFAERIYKVNFAFMLRTDHIDRRPHRPLLMDGAMGTMLQRRLAGGWQEGSPQDGQEGRTAESYEEPAEESLDGPAGRYDKQAQHRDEQAENFDGPAKSFDEPAECFDEPAENIDGPAGRYDKQAQHRDEQAENFDGPAKSFDEPAECFDEPAENINGPAESLDGPAERLNVTNPDVIASIHRAYIAAGAEIIETNTFNANRISLASHGLADQARNLSLAGARIARSIADEAWKGGRNESGMPGSGRKVLVAGSVGPTSRSLTLPSDISNPAWREVDFDTMAGAYREQIEALIEGGADIILIETCFDALNTKAALYALQKVAPGFPAMVSVSVADRSGRTLTGQTLEAFYNSVRHYPLKAFGLNCSLGAEELLPLIREVARFSDVPVLCYPNAGLPNEEGAYDQTPEQMAGLIGRMVSEGLVDIVGGCCGSTPEHIRQLSNMLSKFEGALPPDDPRGYRRAPDGALTTDQLTAHTSERALPGVTLPAVSGLESHALPGGGTGFTPIGERTNVAGSRKFARLIASGAYDEALQIAASQVDAGAGIIDINMDDAMLDAPREMERFVRHISGEPAVASAALMIDSSDWNAILAGLKNAQGRCIVNSVSLKEGEDALIAKARELHALGAAMVVMAFDEQGQAVTFDRKVAIAGRAYRILTERAGIPPEDLIFDCNILSVGTGIPEHARYAVDFIEAVRWIKRHLPGALTSGGVSNLSFAFRGNNTVREAMHAAFLYHAVQAGLDMAIVNPSSLIPYDCIDPALRTAVEEVILDRRPDATERLLSWIAGSQAAPMQEVASQNPPKRAQPPEKERGCVTKPAKTCSTSVSPGETCSIPVSPAETGTASPDGTSSTSVSPAETCTASPNEALAAAIVRGRAEGLENMTLACLERLGNAVSVVEGPLMDGMEQVGKLFGEGKMFLPQVVKSAKLMRDAVTVLEPYFPKEGRGGDSFADARNEGMSVRDGRSPRGAARNRIILATVKGDVHDIGKNITGIVLRCNGFEVTDLGVMVEGERILAEAERLGADIIAVSGLITPSLYQMEELCREMSLRRMHTPLLIGGATTSAVHTAVKLAPLYAHVFYCPDASASAVMAKRLMIDREGTEAAAHREQARLRALREGRTPVSDSSPATPDVARGKPAGNEAGAICSQKTENEPAANEAATRMQDTAIEPTAENGKSLHTGEEVPQEVKVCNGLIINNLDGRQDIPIEELVPLFDERMYLAIWGIPYGKADLSDPAIAETLKEARDTLDRMVRRKEVRVTLSSRFLSGVHRTEKGLDWIDGYAYDGIGTSDSSENSNCDDNDNGNGGDGNDGNDDSGDNSNNSIYDNNNSNSNNNDINTDGNSGDVINDTSAAHRSNRICALPMLRDAQGRCLADWLPEEDGFLRSARNDRDAARNDQGHCHHSGLFGVFAIAVHPTLKHPVGCECPACGGLVERTIRLTLAEAASEWFEARVRERFLDSGFASARNDKQSAGDTGAGQIRIIKPAVGYAACPDHTLKKDVLALLKDPGITLTDSFAMIPDASICAFVFTPEQTSGDMTMPDIRWISEDTARRYAAARGFTPEQFKQFLGHLL